MDCNACPVGRFGNPNKEGLTTVADCVACPAGKKGAKDGVHLLAFILHPRYIPLLPYQVYAPVCTRYTCICTICTPRNTSKHPLNTTIYTTIYTLYTTGKKGVKDGAQSLAAGCADCVVGQNFQDREGQTSCLPDVCPRGEYAFSRSLLASQKTDCLDCPAGTYSGASGLTKVEQCNMCPLGFFSNLTRQTEASQCTACPPGKRGRAAGLASMSKACVDCKVGLEYQASPGAATCVRVCTLYTTLLPYAPMCTHYTCIYTAYTPLNTFKHPLYTL